MGGRTRWRRAPWCEDSFDLAACHRHGSCLDSIRCACRLAVVCRPALVGGRCLENLFERSLVAVVSAVAAAVTRRMLYDIQRTARRRIGKRIRAHRSRIVFAQMGSGCPLEGVGRVDVSRFGCTLDVRRMVGIEGLSAAHSVPPIKIAHRRCSVAVLEFGDGRCDDSKPFSPFSPIASVPLVA